MFTASARADYSGPSFLSDLSTNIVLSYKYKSRTEFEAPD